MSNDKPISDTAQAPAVVYMHKFEVEQMQRGARSSALAVATPGGVYSMPLYAATVAPAAAAQPDGRTALANLETLTKLRTFLNAAGGEGFVLDGVDGGDLYMAIFDAGGNVSDRLFSDQVRVIAFNELFEFQEATGFDTAAEYHATAPQATFECAAHKQGSVGGNDPAECDWPLCGCDPKATEVIAALQECDLLKDRPGKRTPIYQIGANVGGGIAWWDVDKDRYEREKKAGFMKTGIVYREAT